MATFFRHDLRVLPCEGCGAPLEGAASGGAVSCRYCRAEQRLTPREDSPLSVGPRLPEPERLALLRKQDAFARPTPAALAELVVADRLIPWETTEALARWQVARRKLARGRDAAVEEELFVLTRALCTHYADVGALLEVRALAEGALDELGDARHRQVLRAFLAQSAALNGDVAAGEAWLAGCDPRAAELESDGAYRFARAAIDTVRGDFAQVLAVLGQTPTEVSLPNDLDAAAAVLRANAWERMGRLDQAELLLTHLAEHGGPLFELKASELTERYPGLGLCARSWPGAEVRIRRIHAERAKRSGIPGLYSLPVIGGGVVLCCAAVIVGSLAGDYYDLGFGLHPVTVLVVFFVAMTGFLLLVLGTAQGRDARRALRLRSEGRPAAGVVVQRMATGNATMGVPELSVRVLVLEGASGYLATTLLFHRDPQAPEFARGAAVALRIDREDPHSFTLVL